MYITAIYLIKYKSYTYFARLIQKYLCYFLIVIILGFNCYKCNYPCNLFMYYKDNDYKYNCIILYD